MGKKVIARIQTDGSVARLTMKRARNEVLILKDLEIDIFSIESYENATCEQLVTTIEKVRKYLEKRVTNNTSGANPIFRADNYTVAISFPIGGLTTYQFEAIMNLTVEALDGAYFK